MSARFPLKKITRAIALSGLVCVFLLPLAVAQTTATQATVPQPTAAENGEQQTPADSAEQSPATANDSQSVSPAAKQPTQASPAKKPVKVRPRAQIKNQAAKSRLPLASASSTASAPAVPGVNDFAPGKIVISNGGAKEVRLQLTPTATPAEAAQQRQQIRHLIFITNENLKRIAGHDLNPTQQDMLEQVHNYMTQARAADKVGELQRAQILTSKARQLSDDLAGVRTILKLWPW